VAATVALCMIVRDEARVIERCLASCRPLVDTWVICDTGSTDETAERIEAAFEGLPGALHHRPWRDFGTNRSELMALARGAADYLLLLDADMTIRVDRQLPSLDADAYLVRHRGSVDYAVPRLVRGDRDWRFVGSTHEHLHSDAPFTQESLDALVVEHHADGGRRDEKFERDRMFLERDVRADPEDARATFYLAQTYRDLGRTEESIDLYLRRAALGGWDQEVFYSQYQAGVLRAATDPDAAAGLLLDALETRPGRAEPLLELARLARMAGRHQAAHLYAARGLELPYPDDILFVHRSVYDWELLFELSIAAYWIGDVDAALAANDRLLGERNYPPDIHRYVVENRDHCLRALGRPRDRAAVEPLLGELAPSAVFGEIRLEVEPVWPQFNPSIAADGEGGFRAIVRTAGYRVEDDIYFALGDDGTIRTINYLVELDHHLSVRRVAPLAEEGDDVPRFPSPVVGHEDCRLIRTPAGWVATATVRDRNPGSICEVALLRLEGDAVSAVRVLAGPSPERHEKNWMPFLAGGELHFLYSCAPTVVLRCDPASGSLSVVSEDAGPAEARPLRGGSQGIAVEGGTLFVAHEVAPEPGPRRYLHRLLLLGDDFRVSELSESFRFEGARIEFCAGLAPHEGDLLLSYGVDDARAAIARVPAAELLALLRPTAR
jgi:glycosyltransferase involved in cell wall biosynthesis